MNPQQPQQQYPYPNFPPYIYPPNPPQYMYPPIIPQYGFPQQNPQYPYPYSNTQHTYPQQNPYPYPQQQPQSQYPYPYPYPPQQPQQQYPQQQQQYSNFTQQPQTQHIYPPQQIPPLIPQPPGIMQQNNYPPQQVNHPIPPNPPPVMNKIPAVVESRNEGCNICKKNHLARDCWEKGPAVRRERARIEGLCFICLNKNKHRSENCKFNHPGNMYICQECTGRAPHAKNLCLNFRNPNNLPEQNITPVREKSRTPIAVAPQKPRGYLYRSASNSTIGYDEEEEYDREESSEEEEEKMEVEEEENMEVEEAQEKKEKESSLRRSKSLPTF